MVPPLPLSPSPQLAQSTEEAAAVQLPLLVHVTEVMACPLSHSQVKGIASRPGRLPYVRATAMPAAANANEFVFATTIGCPVHVPHRCRAGT